MPPLGGRCHNDAAASCRKFTAVLNAVCALGWHEQLSNGVKLYHATCYLLKADYPDLVSGLHVQARVKATETLKSALALTRLVARFISHPLRWSVALAAA